MVVQHNMQAMNANRMLNITTGAQSKSTEKLSSGYRINRAADDAAGLTISEKMRKQIRGLDQASTNAQDGVSSVQTAEGALTEVHSMLQRMNELAVQAANGTNSKESDRQAIQDEIDQLTTEIDRVAETTKFNEIYLLKGDNASTKNVYMKGHDAGLKGTLTDSAKSAIFVMDTLKEGDKYKIAGKEYTIGIDKAEIIAAIDQYKAADKQITVDGNSYTYKADMTNKITVDIDVMNSANLGVKGLNVTDATGTAATYAVDAISDAIAKVSSQRSALGAVQNRLEHTIDNLDNIVENTTTAESRIRDTDMAEEMVEYSKNNILAQAGQSMLAQANQSTQGVLSLLQ